MKFTHRNPWMMVLLMFITVGIYNIYWIFVTTYELNMQDAKIPNPLLVLIPLINIYWLYRYAKGFCRVMFSDSHPFFYFLLITFFNPLGMIIFQLRMNDFSISKPRG